MNRINIYSLSQSEKFKNSDNPYKSIFASQSGKIVVWLDIFSLFVMPSQWVIKDCLFLFCVLKKKEIYSWPQLRFYRGQIMMRQETNMNDKFDHYQRCLHCHIDFELSLSGTLTDIRGRNGIRHGINTASLIPVK